MKELTPIEVAWKVWRCDEGMVLLSRGPVGNAAELIFQAGWKACESAQRRVEAQQTAVQPSISNETPWSGEANKKLIEILYALDNDIGEVACEINGVHVGINTFKKINELREILLPCSTAPPSPEKG